MNNKTFDTTKWYRVETTNTKVRPLVPETDNLGYVAAINEFGRFAFVFAGDLTVLAERFTVERRLAKEGERFISSEGTIITAAGDFVFHEQWVIVEESST